MVSAPKVNECLRSIFRFCFSSFFPQAFLSLKEISWLYSKITEGDSQAKIHNSNNHSLSAQSSFNKSSRFCTSKKPASVLEQCVNNNTSSHLPPYIRYLPVCLLCMFDKRSYIWCYFIVLLSMINHIFKIFRCSHSVPLFTMSLFQQCSQRRNYKERVSLDCLLSANAGQ